MADKSKTSKKVDEKASTTVEDEDPNLPEKEKPVRVQFPKDATAESIVDAIDKVQDGWAKRHPEKANRLYPTVWDKEGNRIKKV